MNNPGSILKLWSKAVKTHETDKDPKTLPKKGQEQKSKIKQGLTTLKVHGAADMAAPANAQQFVVIRDKVGKVMTRYCRYLKAAKDEDKKILPKYLKTAMQLTAVVLNLDPGNVSQDEEDPSLESLAGVDVAAVEKALAAPDSGEDIDLAAPPPATSAKSPPAAAAKPPPAPAKDAGTEQAANFKTRLQALMAQIQQAGANAASAAAQAKVHLSAAGQLAAKKQFDEANKLLDQAEQLLNKPVGDEKALLLRLEKLLPGITKGKGENTPTGQEIKVRHSELQVLLGKKQFGPASAVLTKIENLLKQGGQAAPSLAAWQAALAKVAGQLKTLHGKIAASNDPDAKGALIEIDLVLNKLIPNPVTADQITLMESFLKDNPVVADLCDLAFDLRKPLLPVLTQLAPQLAK